MALPATWPWGFGDERRKRKRCVVFLWVARMMVFCPAEVGRIKLMERKREHALIKINTILSREAEMSNLSEAQSISMNFDWALPKFETFIKLKYFFHKNIDFCSVHKRKNKIHRRRRTAQPQTNRKWEEELKTRWQIAELIRLSCIIGFFRVSSLVLV